MSKFNLLSMNTKLAKSIAKYNVITAGLAMAPHKRSGFNVCKEAGFCSAVCLAWFSGRMVTKPVREAMTRRAQLLFTNPREFYDRLHDDLSKRVSRQEVLLMPSNCVNICHSGVILYPFKLARTLYIQHRPPQQRASSLSKCCSLLQSVSATVQIRL